MPSIFESDLHKAFPYQFDGEIVVGVIAGGVPSDPNVAESWLRTKTFDSDSLLRSAVAEVMADRGLSQEDATTEVAKRRHLNGFRRDSKGLYIRDYQLAACLKESVSVAADKGRIQDKGLGKNTRKGVLSFFVEHVAVSPMKLHLGVKEPTGIAQRFVSTFRGTGIQYEEYVENAEISFRVMTDHKFTDEEWAQIWLTAERTVGLGASRGQGFGRFEVHKWEPIKEVATKGRKRVSS